MLNKPFVHVISSAEFVKSSDKESICPISKLPEFAFIGRSNVGKSSLINFITNNNKLAKISSKPGKTRLINHFLINKKWFLVDLPGYGFARLSKLDREKFEIMIKDYILKRETLFCLFVLIDSRLEPQAIDVDFIRFLGENNVPMVVVFTKTDKITGNKVESNMAKFKKTLLDEWETLPPIYKTSVIERVGREELLTFIQNHIK